MEASNTAALASQTSSPPALEVEDISVVYQRSIKALEGVSLTVPEGEVVAILGANGAGKTTFLRTVSGLLGFHGGAITSGSYRLWGHSAERLAPQSIVRQGVAQVMEGRRILAQMTVEENLDLGAISVRRRRDTAERKHRMLSLRSWFSPRFTRRRDTAERKHRLLDITSLRRLITAKRRDTAERKHRLLEQFPRLGERRHSVAGYLSGGEQQMLAIARALMSDPRFIILDEPSLGLSPIIAHQIADIIAEIAADGTTVLLVEQNAAMALSLCSYAYVFQTGRIAKQGTSEELLEDQYIQELYLGLAGAETA